MTVSQYSDKAAGPKSGGVVCAWDFPNTYARLHGAFAWQVPVHFNMAQACCARWAAQPNTANNIAVQTCQPGAESTSHSFSKLQERANRLSNALVGMGVQPGDRVAIVMPQRFETAVAYIAVLQMGAVAMPLSQLFGPEALAFRLQDSAAVVAIGDAQTLANVQAVRTQCPALRKVLGVGLDMATQHLADTTYAKALGAASNKFAMVATRSDAPAILIYTSGTTGNPKGALLPHQALIGNLTGFLCSQNWFGFEMAAQAEPVERLRGLTNPDLVPTGSQAIFWSPADWAWTGGLMDALLPSLYFGRPIVAFNGRFSPQAALELLRDCRVTHTFLFPTALKAMMKAFPGSASQTVNQQFDLKLQAIMSAGEEVGDAVFDYCQAQLGVTVNEMFGQTEINYIVGNCAALWPPKPGSMGMGYPGHRLAVIDDYGNECAEGVAGDVAVNRHDIHGQPDPIFFLGYWKNAASTLAKFTGDWCRTGDLASRDAQGYLWYQGRSDDVFKSAGYRIGPGEIENCLVKHPAVANVAVVPKPDAARGAVVKAFVVLAPDFLAARASYPGTQAQFEAELVEQLQTHVRDKLAPYEYPKEIEFLDALPMTTTGKVQRRVLRLQEEARAQALATGHVA
ncbi:AMP-binding protein [Rhodoferax sp.]|uniref:acyl-CoA synthetase n=1 Tax=Rhodoferax sp. TaxID=50421 RepID=UPI0025F4030E|nr:AMP-binding protein [Rhodoferax sp.]